MGLKIVAATVEEQFSNNARTVALRKGRGGKGGQNPAVAIYWPILYNKSEGCWWSLST